jgi:hypothetical protein
MKLSEIALPAAAKSGHWFDYVDAWDGSPKVGVRVKLASTDLDEYRRELTRPMQEFAAKRLQSGRLGAVMPGQEVQDEAQVQAMSKFILIDWEGMVDDAGAPVPCTQQNRIPWLRVRRFRESVLALADQTAAFQEQETGD